MLRQATDLKRFEVRAIDGPIGHIGDFFFDDRLWSVRYFVVTTGSCLNRAEVLISPGSVSGPDWLHRFVPVALTREQVENSPALDPRLPVTREHESALIHHYNWPVYWGVAGFPEVDIPEEGDGKGSSEGQDAAAEATGPAAAGGLAEKARIGRGSRLRSVRAVTGHAIEAVDGRVGDVSDFLMDDLTWEIRYLLVDTCSWWPGKKVLIAPQWIERVGWSQARVYVKLTREAIKAGPAFHPDQPVTPDYPGQLCRHSEKEAGVGGSEGVRF